LENVAFHINSTKDCISRGVAVSFLLLSCAVAIAQVSRTPAAAASPANRIKPYRVLLIVEHGSDPYGIVVHSETDKFQPVAALLKAWSVPFDILRLDQQNLDATYLFGRSGEIRYGAVVWLADLSTYGDQDLASLGEALRAGTGLIVVNSRIADPTLSTLLGLKFKQFYTSTDDFRPTQDHYIVRDLAGNKNDQLSQIRDFSVRLWVQPTSAEVLLDQNQHPVLTVNQVAPGVSAVWLGAPTVPALCSSTLWRNLFFRSLVWSLGYAVVPNVDYSHSVILELDDWGTADKGFLSYWRYLEPSEETIQHNLIEPLRKHHAVASAMVDTGYVDRQSKRVVSPWTQKFTDRYGLHQDYASTRKGLEDGVAEGVLDIESHGWTHMQPDLKSPPGPWWTADLAGDGSVDGWYAEFQDRLRDVDVPAVAQLYHIKRSLTELKQDFGVEPLELKPGGDAWSKSQFNNTAALAARVGLGLFHGDTSTYYLDSEIVLDMANVVYQDDTGYDILDNFHPERWPNHPDGPVIVGFHDRDTALDPNFIEQLFAALPADDHTLGTNQYIGILHTQINSTADDNGLQLTFALDQRNSVYFAKHSSSWQLWLSDPLREQLESSHLMLSIDDKPMKIRTADFDQETITIDLPPGLGNHTWKLKTLKNVTEP
jgi:hypothetical protein